MARKYVRIPIGGISGDGHRICRCIAASDEAQAVGFVGGVAGLSAMRRHQVKQPWNVFIFSARTARTKDGPPGADNFSFDEKIAERRVCRVRRRRSKHNFRVTCHVDRARELFPVGDSDSPQLDIIFGRNRYFDMGVVVVVASLELGASVGKNGFKAVRRRANGLMRP